MIWISCGDGKPYMDFHGGLHRTSVNPQKHRNGLYDARSLNYLASNTEKEKNHEKYKNNGI